MFGVPYWSLSQWANARLTAPRYGGSPRATARRDMEIGDRRVRRASFGRTPPAASAGAAYDDCTLAPTAAVASIPFAPELAIPGGARYVSALRPVHLRTYGFLDAFNRSFDFEGLSLQHGRCIPGVRVGGRRLPRHRPGRAFAMIENYRSGHDLGRDAREPVRASRLSIAPASTGAGSPRRRSRHRRPPSAARARRWLVSLRSRPRSAERRDPTTDRRPLLGDGPRRRGRHRAPARVRAHASRHSRRRAAIAVDAPRTRSC